MNITEALQAVVHNCSNGYAKAYARAALEDPAAMQDMNSQLLYVRSNLSHWRGPLAREVKKVIDEALS